MSVTSAKFCWHNSIQFILLVVGGKVRKKSFFCNIFSPIIKGQKHFKCMPLITAAWGLEGGGGGGGLTNIYDRIDCRNC